MLGTVVGVLNDQIGLAEGVVCSKVDIGNKRWRDQLICGLLSN